AKDGGEGQDTEDVEEACCYQAFPAEPELRAAGGEQKLGEQDGDRDTPHRVVTQRPLRPHPVDPQRPTTQIPRVKQVGVEQGSQRQTLLDNPERYAEREDRGPSQAPP